MGGHRGARERLRGGVAAAIGAAVTALALAVPATVPAAGGEVDAPEPALEVASVDTSDYPSVGVTVVARKGVPSPDALSVTEDGLERPATVDLLADLPVEVVVVVDAGGRRRRAAPGGRRRDRVRAAPAARRRGRSGGGRRATAAGRRPHPWE